MEISNNMAMDKSCVVVVIPIYKTNMTTDEALALKQCLKVLFQYDIIFACPDDLDMSTYDKFVGHSLPKERFNKHFFDGIEGYNELMTSQSFYKRFDKYEYLLIYQLDAWVFSDQLLKWCQKGYDYIGAPWFVLNMAKEEDLQLWRCGNGGLSLRRTKRFLEITEPSVMQALKMKNPELCEDLLFTVGTSDTPYTISCPTAEESAGFSIEWHPSYLYKLNGNTLPFGCHAWRRFEYDTFWHDYIDAPSTLNVSIVTVTYNNLDGLIKTRESILSQSFRRYEWIVIDCGSTDGTKGFLEKHTDEITYWQSHKNKEVFEAQNEGTLYAKGDYIIYMNSGVVFHDENVLDNVFGSFHDADILYGDWITQQGNEKEQKSHAPTEVNFPWFLTGDICQQAMFIKTNIIKKSPYNTAFKICSDYDKCIEFSYQGHPFEYIPYCISIVKRFEVSSQQRYKIMREHKLIKLKYYQGSLLNLAKQYNSLKDELSRLHTEKKNLNNEIQNLHNKCDKRLKNIRLLVYLCIFFCVLIMVLIGFTC